MREKAESDGQDLLVIDTGDRIEGNGLYDASEPKGQYTFDIIKEQQIDLLCSGNHELYKQNASENEYLVTVPDFKDNYLASNLDIFDPKTGELVPLAPRFKKFTTKNQGLTILSFGFIFNFVGNSNNTVIQPVEKTVEEQWFQDAIRDRDVDLFVVIGHVDLQTAEFDAVYKAIRAVQWDTPIQFFGGHSHIRNYKKFDSISYGLESGRFMETVGFQSIDGIAKKNGKELQARASTSFSRKYIDNNLFSFYHHTGLNSSTFHTSHGKNVSKLIQSARKELKLDNTYGCAPKDLWMSRAQYPSKDSIFTWLEEDVLPEIVGDKDRVNHSRLAVINTGAIRFDIFEGPFTKDSTYIVSPFTSGFRYIKDIPMEKASKLISILNNAGQVLENQNAGLQNWMLAPPGQEVTGPLPYSTIYQTGRASQAALGKGQSAFSPDLTPGYTTKDDAGSDGDDTVHSPIKFYKVPNCIQSIINGTKGPADGLSGDIVDVVYIEFIQPWVLLAFGFLGLEYTVADTAPYMYGENLTTLLAKWVSENWKDNC